SIVSISMHLASMLLLTWMLAMIAGGPLWRRLGLGVGAALLAGGPGLANRELAAWTVAWWPAQPDLLSFLFSVMALGFAAAYRRSGQVRWAVPVPIAFILSAVSKEIGFITGIGIGLLLVVPSDWYSRRPSSLAPQPATPA